ncbi:TPA: hypothetical protein ACQM90_000373 [Streptococcus pyogenes]
MIDLKRNLFKIDVRAQKDEEKVFMRTACCNILLGLLLWKLYVIINWLMKEEIYGDFRKKT